LEELGFARKGYLKFMIKEETCNAIKQKELNGKKMKRKK